MGKIMKKTLNNGFTLIELVIIMVILGVLAAVAVLGVEMSNSVAISSRDTTVAAAGLSVDTLPLRSPTPVKPKDVITDEDVAAASS